SAVPLDAQGVGNIGQAAVGVVPVVRIVGTAWNPPKSGFGSRLLPVIGAWEMPYPPRITSPRFSANFHIFGLHANPKRGSKSLWSTGTRYLERPPIPAIAKTGTLTDVGIMAAIAA